MLVKWRSFTKNGGSIEAYGAIRRKPVESLKIEREGRSKATPPFGFAQGHESFDLAQDRELVERPVEWADDALMVDQKLRDLTTYSSLA